MFYFCITNYSYLGYLRKPLPQNIMIPRHNEEVSEKQFGKRVEKMVDELTKQKFRDEFCNIVKMNKSKVADIPKGSVILRSVQSLDEFNAIIPNENWAVTQTPDSNVLFFDLDTNDYDRKLDKLFNRRRDKYVNHSEVVNSKHGFVKVKDADHNWCKEFARKFHLKSGIEIYAEKHWVIFAGVYHNDKNLDDPQRQTKWYPLDDLHVNPIIEMTKENLGLVFGSIQLDTSFGSAHSDMRVDEIVQDNFKVKAGQDREVFVIKYMTSRLIKNPEFLDDNDMILLIARKYNDKHCNPPISTERLERTIKQSINYALTAIQGRQTDNVKKSVIFDLNDKHSLIINCAMKSVNELTKDDREINLDTILPLVTEHLKNKEIMNEYGKNCPKHNQLLDLVNLVVENSESELEFLQSYLESKPSNKFAHINEVDDKDQFNCWHWTKKKWSDNTAHYILQSLIPLKGDEIKINAVIATNISNNLSGSEKTLQVVLDSKEYINQMMSIITNSQGEYFDFKDGKIKQVDPHWMFFKQSQLQIDFKEDIEKPEKFLKFVEERFPDEFDAKVLIDHLAGSFLHTSVLGSKPKMLYICGQHDSYKSLIIEIMKKIIHKQSISKVSVSQLADKWGMSLIMEKILNYSEEENPVEPKDPANLKDAITAESSYVHVKFMKKLVYSSRFPRHLIMCNKITPIPKDDDDESIFIRNQYLEIKKIVDDPIKLRNELFDDDEIQKIGMFLLKRASEIFNGDKINTQSLKDARKRHINLTQGSLEQFIGQFCITKGVTSEIGTSFNWLLAKYNETQKSRISNKLLSQQLEDMGFEKKTRNWVFRNLNEPNVFSEIFYETMHDDSKTQQTVIMGIKPSKIERTAVPGIDDKPTSSGGLVDSI